MSTTPAFGFCPGCGGIVGTWHTAAACAAAQAVQTEAAQQDIRAAERHRIAEALRAESRLTTCHTPETRRALDAIAGRVERGEL